MEKLKKNMTWEELVAACKNLGEDTDLNTIFAKSVMIDAYIARTLNTGKKSAHNILAINENNVNSAAIWLEELSRKAYNIVAKEKGIAPLERE